MLLNTLLDKAGLQLKPKKNDFLHKVIVVIGSDGYSCVIADGEIQAHFGNESILVAYEINGKSLQLLSISWRIVKNFERNGCKTIARKSGKLRYSFRLRK